MAVNLEKGTDPCFLIHGVQAMVSLSLSFSFLFFTFFFCGLFLVTISFYFCPLMTRTRRKEKLKEFPQMLIICLCSLYWITNQCLFIHILSTELLSVAAYFLPIHIQL